MSSTESSVSYESFREDAPPATVRRHKSCLLNRNRSAPNASSGVHPGAIRTPRHFSCPSAIMSPSSPRRERVAGRLKPDTDFKYVGSIEGSGWKRGQVPLVLEWYPEKLDRRSMLKFLESGREYVVGLDPICDIFFQTTDPDSGISGQHLKIKVLFKLGLC